MEINEEEFARISPEEQPLMLFRAIEGTATKVVKAMEGKFVPREECAKVHQAQATGGMATTIGKAIGILAFIIVTGWTTYLQYAAPTPAPTPTTQPTQVSGPKVANP